MIRWRWPVQIIMLIVFVALSVIAARPSVSPITPSAWIIGDPLVVLVAIVGSKAVWTGALWAVVLVAATMLVGRFFCGWICPLGTLLDLTDRYIWRRHGSPPGDEIRPRAKWKQITLLLILVSAVFGVSTGLAFDPIVLMTRTVELVLVPLAGWLGYGGVRFVRLMPGQASFSAPALETPPLYSWITLTAVILVGIVALGRIERRFWCRNLCPLGAMLGWLGRTGFVKRYVDDECTSCSLCVRDCPMGAIPAKDFSETHKGECILCLRCQSVCSRSAVRFGTKGAQRAPGFQPERRQVLAAIAAGAGLGLLGAGSSQARARPPHVIRPPGALPEEEFLSRCTRCLACVEACPTHALQPLGIEAGWEGLWTPVLVPTSGGCEEPCYNCTQVCPTEAIRRLTHEEKSFARIGTARISRERCLAWEELKPCLVCDEVCPYNAIDFLVITDYRGTQRRPVLNEDKCMGCGICEHECPVRESRAIFVEHYGEERMTTGSYITPEKRRLREAPPDPNIDYLREHRISSPSGPVDGEPSESPLPPGIIME